MSFKLRPYWNVCLCFGVSGGMTDKVQVKERLLQILLS